MNLHQVNPWLIGLGVFALLCMWLTVRGARRRSATATRTVTRMGGNTVRALVTAAVIGGTQWAVLTNTTDPRVWAAVLGVPAFLAAALLVRLLTTTHEIHPTSKGGKR